MSQYHHMNQQSMKNDCEYEHMPTYEGFSLLIFYIAVFVLVQTALQSNDPICQSNTVKLQQQYTLQTLH